MARLAPPERPRVQPLRQGTRPIIILVNNDEYTVKRVIHGADQTHTDVAA